MIYIPYRPRAFVLGAGFSALAGLPTAQNLLHHVRAEARNLVGPDNPLERSLSSYKRYREHTTCVQDPKIDLEQFVEYMDHRHFLQFNGAETNTEANADQRLLRQATALTLLRHTPPAEDLPKAYHVFATGLRPGDVVLTFNYDLIIESLLDLYNRRYQRYPLDYGDEKRNRNMPSHLSSEPNPPIVVMKLHGSVDWVDQHYFDAGIEWIAQQYDTRDAYEHALDYNPLGSHPTEPLVDSGEGPDNPLGSIRVLSDPMKYFESGPAAPFRHPPMILAPSYAKLAYGARFAPLWRILGDLPYDISGLAFIGYSIPKGDSHARQAIYNLVNGYEDAMFDPENYGLHEPIAPDSDEWLNVGENETISRIQVVNWAKSPDEKKALHKAYRFFPAYSTDFVYSGFDTPSASELVRGAPLCACRNCT